MKGSVFKKTLAIIVAIVLIIGISAGTAILIDKKTVPAMTTVENGQPYYENVQQNQKYIMMDVKNQKRIDLSRIDDKFNYTTYGGKSCRYNWISETELIIFCQDGNEEYIQTVINVDEG